eukprot:5401875-Prymnesium_polylepis.1
MGDGHCFDDLWGRKMIAHALRSLLATLESPLGGDVRPRPVAPEALAGPGWFGRTRRRRAVRAFGPLAVNFFQAHKRSALSFAASQPRRTGRRDGGSASLGGARAARTSLTPLVRCGGDATPLLTAEATDAFLAA